MPSKPNILIIGQSGAGKTCSLEKLLDKYAPETALVDFERKGLPFLFDTKRLAMFIEVDDYSLSLQEMTKVKASNAKIVVYDSFTKFCEMAREYCKTKYSGWDIWNGYNSAIRKFLDFNKSMERLVICTAVDEVVYVEQAEGSRLSRLRCFVQGKEFEGKVEKEFLIVVFCSARKDKSGRIGYFFAPHTDGLTSAKTPQWLALPDQMPNNVSIIVDKLIEQKIV